MRQGRSVASQQQGMQLPTFCVRQVCREIDEIAETGANGAYGGNKLPHTFQDFRQAERRMGGLTRYVQCGAGKSQISRRF
jgi:hypothetical protein